MATDNLILNKLALIICFSAYYMYVSVNILLSEKKNPEIIRGAIFLPIFGTKLRSDLGAESI